MEHEFKSRAVQTTLEATIIRADGTREELGVIGYWHRNPLKRVWWRCKSGMKRMISFIKRMRGR